LSNAGLRLPACRAIKYRESGRPKRRLRWLPEKAISLDADLEEDQEVLIREGGATMSARSGLSTLLAGNDHSPYIIGFART